MRYNKSHCRAFDSFLEVPIFIKYYHFYLNIWNKTLFLRKAFIVILNEIFLLLEKIPGVLVSLLLSIALFNN